jgi:hypothetical protein
MARGVQTGSAGAMSSSLWEAEDPASRQELDQGVHPASPGQASMTRGRSTFRRRDVTSLVRGVVAAGLNVLRVEVGKDGGIVVVTDYAQAVTSDDEAAESMTPEPIVL